jgi:hypothetical protein
MKNFICSCAAALILLSYACNSQTDAQNKANEITAMSQQAAKEDKSVSDGNYVKATINGKKWESKKTTRYGPESSYKLINGETDEYTISFQIHKPQAGLKREFNKEYQVDLVTDDGYFNAEKGAVTVTKADDKWIEGTFYFTAKSSSSSKTYEVTDGSFRIAAN